MMTLRFVFPWFVASLTVVVTSSHPAHGGWPDSGPGINEDGIIMAKGDGGDRAKSSVQFQKDVQNLKDLRFENDADSVRWQIPDQWSVIFFDDVKFRKPLLILEGKGVINDLEDDDNAQNERFELDDRFESLRWYKTADVASVPGIKNAQRPPR